jgi:hypothetical protein
MQNVHNDNAYDPPDPNAPMVVLPALTRNQFWGGPSAVFGTMVVGYIGLIYVLMSVFTEGSMSAFNHSKTLSKLLSLQMSRLRICPKTLHI